MHDVGPDLAQQPPQREYPAQVVCADRTPQRQPMERLALRGRTGQHRVVEALAERRDQVDFRVSACVQPGDQVGQVHGDAAAGRFDDERDAQRRHNGRRGRGFVRVGMTCRAIVE